MLEHFKPKVVQHLVTNVFPKLAHSHSQHVVFRSCNAGDYSRPLQWCADSADRKLSLEILTGKLGK
jgi:hypothetical protein